VKMATATQVVLTPEIRGVESVGALTEASARVTSEVLQRNHEDNHIFFNKEGFHSRFFFLLCCC
jgi:hypothetical protein